MKKKLLFLVLAGLFVLACSESKPTPSPIPGGEDPITEQEEKVAIAFKLNGIHISEYPLDEARSGSNDLYGIQINSMGPADFPNAGTKVAYGVFDNLNGAEIELVKAKKYYIEVTHIPNGKLKCHYHSDRDCWELPFNTHGWGGSPLNTFVYSNAEYLYGLTYGRCTPVGDGNNRANSKYNEVDWYYGVLENYAPVEGGEINVDMKRTVFGLTFRAKKMPDNPYAHLLIRLDADENLGGAPKTYYLPISPSQEISELVIPFIALEGISQAYHRDDYQEDLKISIGTDSRPTEIYYGTVKVKRNTMHVIAFDAVKEESVPNGLRISLDNSQMVEENVGL